MGAAAGAVAEPVAAAAAVAAAPDRARAAAPRPVHSPPAPRGRVADDAWRRTAAAWRKRLASIEATHARLRGGPFPEMRERPFVAS